MGRKRIFSKWKSYFYWNGMHLFNSFRCAQALKRERNRTYKYYAAICCVAKDEEPYLKEWIAHHLSLGFQHIYICDNNDEEGLDSFFKEYYRGRKSYNI